MAAKHYTAKIPFDRIVKIGIWSNESEKTTLTSVYSKLKNQYPDKEVYICNGGFFNMGSNWSACFGLKVNGKVYSDGWDKPFIGFNGNTIKFCTPNSSHSQFTDAISAYPALVENKKRSKYFSYCIDTSDRGRSMLGYNSKEVIISTIQDVSGSTDFTPDEEINFMVAQGCDYAINLDGGGSAQCNFNGKVITSSRIVHNFVYIIANPLPNYCKDSQEWLNYTYKSNLVVDGIMGNATLKAIIKGMQKEIGVVADGIWGNASNRAFKILYLNSPNNTQNKIKLLQCALCRKGYWSKPINGIFDSELKSQILSFQKSNRLEADGIVGAGTITALFK